jgi:HSP20 family protein
MTIIRRSSPRSDLMTFRAAVDRLFDDATFRPLAWGGAEARLPLDITSSEDAVTIEAALPGIHPDDVEITVHQDNLTIGVKEQAERETREGERVYRELRRSSGTRTLTLPSGMDVDNAVATFENGMLRLSIPRVEAAKPRQIPLSTVTEAVAANAGGGESQATEAEAGAHAAEKA